MSNRHEEYERRRRAAIERATKAIERGRRLTKIGAGLTIYLLASAFMNDAWGSLGVVWFALAVVIAAIQVRYVHLVVDLEEILARLL